MTLIGFLMTAPGDVSAMKNSAGMPKNAHAKEYGSGWSCDRGYREVKGRCIAVKVPANAYPTDTSFSRGWECGRGFRDIKDACVAIKVRTVRRHINWNNHRPDLREDLAHLVQDIKRRICGIASAGFPAFSV